MYRLNITKLRKEINKRGIKTGHALAKSTGIGHTTAYRILRGAAQPDLITAMRLSVAYDFDLRDVMDEVDETAEATA
ncbi:helix-turn-helix domain-containing protein [Streptomyces sp. 1222.5]|uniref:helix-turn-helix domain-containing protein n=1 Tax=Streptomyces sp. 1222.5 TaxID=1881026 RepID=UPI003EBAC8EC